MSEPRERVVLVHGLGRTRHSMRRLKRAFEAAGYDVVAWDYPSRRHSVAALTAMFRDWLQSWAAGAPVHFVGHSLGGLIIRAGLIEPPPVIDPGRVVMIASPNRGIGINPRLPGGRWIASLYGKPALELQRSAHWLSELGRPDTKIGVIAGDRPFHPFNLTAYISAIVGPEGAHDGTVEVASAKLDGMTDFVVVDAHHTFICDHPQVIRQTLRFIATGRFGDRPGGGHERHAGV